MKRQSKPKVKPLNLNNALHPTVNILLKPSKALSVQSKILPAYTAAVISRPSESLPFSGAIFEQGTDEVQTAFKFAMLNHNQNITGRKFELQAFVDVINTADAFKLSRLSK